MSATPITETREKWKVVFSHLCGWSVTATVYAKSYMEAADAARCVLCEPNNYEIQSIKKL